MKRTSLCEISDRVVNVIRTVLLRMNGIEDVDDEVELTRATRAKGR